MKSGICPKCGSREVHTNSPLSSKTKAGPNYANTIPISASTTTIPAVATLDNYVCGVCGYVESYISDPAKIARIVENWPRVATQEEAEEIQG